MEKTSSAHYPKRGIGGFHRRSESKDLQRHRIEAMGESREAAPWGKNLDA